MSNLATSPSASFEDKKDSLDPNPIPFKAALEARRAALAAMPEERILRRARLDVVTVSAMASAAARSIDEVRDQVIAHFGPAAGELIDGLDTTARAARQAEVELGITEEASELQGLHREVMAHYERLILDADSLVVRGFMPKERLAGSRDLRSYQGALHSLLGVIAVLRESWSKIAGHTPVVPADLDRADEVCSRMATALSTRQTGMLRAAAAETRVRALSLLVREYELVRRMVTFVRWFEGDADRIMPSLYAGRGGRRTRANDDAPESDVDTDVVDDAVTPVAGPVPNNGGGPFTS